MGDVRRALSPYLDPAAIEQAMVEAGIEPTPAPSWAVAVDTSQTA